MKVEWIEHQSHSERYLELIPGARESGRFWTAGNRYVELRVYSPNDSRYNYQYTINFLSKDDLFMTGGAPTKLRAQRLANKYAHVIMDSRKPTR